MKYVLREPTTIEAIQFDGMNIQECERFLEGNYDNRISYPNVKTPLGVVRVDVGDYIIKGGDDFFVSNSKDFELAYKPVEERRPR